MQKYMSSFGITLDVEGVIRAIIDFMAAAPKRKYKVIIGSDSQRYQEGGVDFVTAVVVHRVGNGGRYFYRHLKADRKFHTLRDRITEEVMLSLRTAQAFLEASKALKAPEFDFEIHVDVGENGATKTLIQELVGMIRANNFEVRTKPQSYAASKVADRHV